MLAQLAALKADSEVLPVVPDFLLTSRYATCMVAIFLHPAHALTMRVFHCRSQSFLLPLRWVLAVVLILNGAVAPPVMAHVAKGDDYRSDAHAMSVHCHHHDEVPSSASVEQQKKRCGCCTGLDVCQCGGIVIFALPKMFPDMRPFSPDAFAVGLIVPQLALAPRYRLLRPPIV